MVDSFPHPAFNRFPQLAQTAFEEMIGAFDQDQLLRLGQRCYQGFESCSRTELIARAADEQFWLRAVVQKIECVGARGFGVGGYGGNWRSHPDQGFHSWIGTCCPKADGSAEGESSKEQRQVKL